MTAGSQASHDGADLFVADFYPKLGEYLAEQHAAGYDAGSGRARFRSWLGEHAEAGEATEDERLRSRIAGALDAGDRVALVEVPPPTGFTGSPNNDGTGSVTFETDADA